MEKYVKLMADYCSSGVWEIDGIMMDIDALPISERLRVAIRKWVDYYETNDDYLAEDDRTSDFDVDFFGEEGYKIAKLIKAELPDWTVMYYDEREFTKHFEGGTLIPATATVYEIK